MNPRLRSSCWIPFVLGVALWAAVPLVIRSADFKALRSQPLNTWLKRTPLPAAPVSPRLGYEGACVWDSVHQVIIRYGGHNQGGGGEQGSEVWTCDPLQWNWKLHQPNTSPPGVCCDAQNVFDPGHGRYIRFPSFSGSRARSISMIPPSGPMTSPPIPGETCDHCPRRTWLLSAARRGTARRKSPRFSAAKAARGRRSPMIRIAMNGAG
jgi:hypothetical protein